MKVKQLDESKNKACNSKVYWPPIGMWFQGNVLCYTYHMDVTSIHRVSHLMQVFVVQNQTFNYRFAGTLWCICYVIATRLLSRFANEDHFHWRRKNMFQDFQNKNLEMRAFRSPSGSRNEKWARCIQNVIDVVPVIKQIRDPGLIRIVWRSISVIKLINVQDQQSISSRFR